MDVGNGNIRIWKDYSVKDSQKLVTAFSSIQGHKPGLRHLNAVVDWQQQSGYLVHVRYPMKSVGTILMLITLKQLRFSDVKLLVCFRRDIVHYALGPGQRATCQFHSFIIRLRHLSIGELSYALVVH